ncbi:MAG: hypothetical protein L6R38_003079 [Xanthoria sp. 2 TBL-2021]|nr:MAG: hypothetical protein L6R38_003079 [Xanthoria sp. 2 TBL-2021]
MNLTTLPPELLVQITASLPDLSSVDSLVQSSRFFHLIWKHHSTTICQTILQRSSLPCSDDADRLAYFEEQYLGFPASSHAQRLLRLSRLAGRVCDIFVSEVVTVMPRRYQNPYITVDERVRLHTVFYSIWMAVHLAVAQTRTNNHPVEADTLSTFFENTSLRTLYCYSEIALWFLSYLDIELRTEVQNGMMALFTLDKEHAPKVWEKTMQDIYDAWMTKCTRFVGYCGVLHPEGAPIGVFAVFDDWQDYLERIPLTL